MTATAWLAWAVYVMVVALGTTNPLYLGVVALCVLLVALAAPMEPEGTRALRLAAGFAAVMFAVSILVAVINGSPGATVLFSIPAPALPEWLGGLALGGPVTAEGLVAAAIRGLAIACVVGAFATFNACARPQDVLRLAPATLFHAGLVVTIGLTLLPASVADLGRLREIRALRGAPGGVRGLASLVTPAVVGGLERSMRLAEALEARGYAARRRSTARQRWAGLAAPFLLLAAAGLWFYFPDLEGAAIGLAVAGALALAAAVVPGRSSPRARLLEPERVPRAGVAAWISFVAACVVLVLGSGGVLDLGYSPFRGLETPPFEPVGACIALLAGWPLLLVASVRRPATAAAALQHPQPERL